MKKILLLLVAVLVLGCFASCGSDNSEATTEAPTATETQAPDVVLEISKTSLADPEDFKATMEEYGAEVEDLGDENAFQFTFTKAEHDTLLKDKKAETVSAFEDLENSEESYIDKIEYDEDFRNLKIYVDKDKKPEGVNAEEFTAASYALVYQTYIDGIQRTLVEIYYTGETERVSSFTLPTSYSY